MSFELFVARRYLTARRKQAFISVITLISVGRHRHRRRRPGHRHRPHHRVPGRRPGQDPRRDLPRHGLGPRRPGPRRLRRDGRKDPGPPGRRVGLARRLQHRAHHRDRRQLGGARQGHRFRAGAAGLGLAPDARGRRDPAGRAGPATGSSSAGSWPCASAPRSATSSTSSPPPRPCRPMGLLPKRKTFEVAGIFNTGLYEFDSATALVAIGVAQKLFGLEGRASYIQVKLADIFAAPGDRRRGSRRSCRPSSTSRPGWSSTSRSSRPSSSRRTSCS